MTLLRNNEIKEQLKYERWGTLAPAKSAAEQCSLPDDAIAIQGSRPNGAGEPV